MGVAQTETYALWDGHCPFVLDIISLRVQRQSQGGTLPKSLLLWLVLVFGLRRRTRLLQIHFVSHAIL